MITFTDSAIAKISDIIAEENKSDIRLRIYVNGGGCSGFTYGFMLDTIQDDDISINLNNILDVVVDHMSMQYLDGSCVDYKEELTGASFVIDNPNAQTTCGCGSSFSM